MCALDSQPQVIKFTSCLPIVGGSLGTPASSTTKTNRHDRAEILFHVALKHQKSNQIKSIEMGSLSQRQVNNVPKTVKQRSSIILIKQTLYKHPQNT